MHAGRMDNTIKHLKTQIAVSDSVGSDFCYIMTNEARNCLELAETRELLIMTPVKAETEGDGKSTWWYVCGECHSSLNPNDKFCHECGRRVIWG